MRKFSRGSGAMTRKARAFFLPLVFLLAPGGVFSSPVAGCQYQLVRGTAFQCCQGIEDGLLKTAVVTRLGIDNLTSTNGHAGGGYTQDETIAAGHYGRSA